MIFLVCKGPSNDDVGVARGIVFQEIRPGAGFKTSDFVEEKLGVGATVERLRASILGNFFLSVNIMQYCKSTARPLEHLPGICPDGRL